MKALPLLMTVAAALISGCDRGNRRSSVQTSPLAASVATPHEQSVSLRYLLPAPEPPSSTISAPQWGLAAPVADGFSDPNRIVYDEAYMDQYVEWAMNAAHVDGPATYSIATRESVVQVASGLDESYLGQRFRAEQLMRFLQTRAEGQRIERTFQIENRELRQLLRDPESHVSRRLRNSPWDRDTATVMSLLALARYKPAYRLFTALLSDPALSVRSQAALGLGRIAPEVPEAVTDLARLLPDKELGNDAASGLTMAGAVAVPALIEAFDHSDPAVRNRAVLALARMHPFEAAVPGLLAALDNSDSLVREWAVSVVLDMQSRGVTVEGSELVRLLAKRLTDGNLNVRWQCAIILGQMKPIGDLAATALRKAATEDENADVRHRAAESLRTICAQTPDRR